MQDVSVPKGSHSICLERAYMVLYVGNVPPACIPQVKSLPDVCCCPFCCGANKAQPMTAHTDL